MKASDILVRALEHEGVRYVFGVPGEENLDFLESLRASTQIELVVCRHEQAAGFMAATHGRLTGSPAVCLATLGPGATNLLTAAAYAHLGAMPMLMITGQKPIKSSKQGRFQIIDVIEMMRPVTKYTRQLVHPQNIAGNVREAFRLATEERPGAVHLELPEDVARETSDQGLHLFPRGGARRPAAEEKAIKRAVDLLESAKRPLLVIGAGANRTRTSKMLRRFVDQTGIPFVTTQMGKGVIDERHPRYLGTAALSDNDFVHRAVEAADLIINVGHDVVEKPPFIMHPGGVKVIHLNFFSAVVDPVYFPELEVVGDIGNAIWQLCREVKTPSHWDFSFFERVKGRVDEHISMLSHDEADPGARGAIKPQRLVAAVRDLMPENGIIALDNGMYKIWFARGYSAYQPNTILLDNALATMGAGLPSAMAAALVFPERRVMAICGDGGFMMNSQELETAVRLKLNLVVLILRDEGYGMIKWKQDTMGFADWGLDFGNPDFVKYAESYGARGHRVDTYGALTKTVQQALEAPGVDLVDVPVDYRENAKLTQDLKVLSAQLETPEATRTGT